MDVAVIDVDKEQTKKKLKQTRLSFQVLNSKIKIGEHTAKKRKLSDSIFADDSKYIKHSRSNNDDGSQEVRVISPVSPTNVTEIPEEQEQEQERDVNQPEITNFFKTQTNNCLKDNNSISNCITKKCYVDLSDSKVLDEPLKDTKIENNKIINEVDHQVEDKENINVEIEETNCTGASVVDLTQETEQDEDDDEKFDELENSVTCDDDKLNFLQQIGLNDDLNTSLTDKTENKIGHVTELTPVKGSPTTTRQLTPKQLQRKLEIKKKQEEKERQRQEKLKKQQEEKEKRIKQKQELEEQKKKERDEKEEQRRKEREEKEEQRRKEREEKERKRQAEIDQKNEDRRKKEQEKLELELKKKKASEAFVKFFVSKENENKKTCYENVQNTNVTTTSTNFMPFQIKSDMRMAPIFRANLTDAQKLRLDTELNSDVSRDRLYLEELKRGKPCGKSTKTWALENDADVVCIDEDIGTENVIQLVPSPEKMRVKLLQFHENRRPPYWGTWRKKSKLIKSRRPLGTDSTIFNYEIDSDDEWEEDEPGESLHGSDDEKDSDCDEKENEYEIDNEFMVPHGYLSDEEIIDGEDDGQPESPDSPNSHKLKLKALEIEFEAERKEKTERLKPRLFGCIWSDRENKQPPNTPEQIRRFMYNNQILFSDPVIILTNDINEFVTASPSSSAKMAMSPKKKRTSIPEQYIPNLIRLLHGNTNGKLFLLKEFRAFLHTIDQDLLISKKRFDLKLKEIASWMPCPDDGPMHNKYCWYVKKDVRDKYNCDVSIPNCWQYHCKKKESTSPVKVE